MNTKTFLYTMTLAAALGAPTLAHADEAGGEARGQGDLDVTMSVVKDDEALRDNADKALALPEEASDEAHARAEGAAEFGQGVAERAKNEAQESQGEFGAEISSEARTLGEEMGAETGAEISSETRAMNSEMSTDTRSEVSGEARAGGNEARGEIGADISGEVRR